MSLTNPYQFCQVMLHSLSMPSPSPMEPKLEESAVATRCHLALSLIECRALFERQADCRTFPDLQSW